MRWVERAAIVIVSLAIAVGVIVVLSGGLAGSRDDPGVASSAGPPPGTAYRDQGDAQLEPGQRRPAYDSDPPTSGAHLAAAVTRNDAAISTDQLLQALALGNVVFLYSGSTPPRGLQAVADSVAPRFTAALARSGQAVILARWPRLRQITAVAWTHMLRTDSAPALRGFAQYWVGRGARARTTTVAGTG